MGAILAAKFFAVQLRAPVELTTEASACLRYMALAMISTLETNTHVLMHVIVDAIHNTCKKVCTDCQHTTSITVVFVCVKNAAYMYMYFMQCMYMYMHMYMYIHE